MPTMKSNERADIKANFSKVRHVIQKALREDSQNFAVAVNYLEQEMDEAINNSYDTGYYAGIRHGEEIASDDRRSTSYKDGQTFT